MARLNFVTVPKILLLVFTIYISFGISKSNGAEKNNSLNYGVITGCWDVTVQTSTTEYPSWFEIIEKDGILTGIFVGRFGSARPIKLVTFDGDLLTLSLPPQYEAQKEQLVFTGKVNNGLIEGETKTEKGEAVRYRAERAPALKSQGQPKWGTPINLIQDATLSNWVTRNQNIKNSWTVQNDVLINAPKGVDIMTKEKFCDFKLHIEFKLANKSNSGIYLRGRYEVQIQDTYGMHPESHRCCGIYGFIAPTVMTVKRAGEWNTADITLVGRNVTLILNDIKIIDDVEIPGITGGAIDSREGEPGPLLLQGDHGYIEFRNIILTPALE